MFFFIIPSLKNVVNGKHEGDRKKSDKIEETILSERKVSNVQNVLDNPHTNLYEEGNYNHQGGNDEAV